MNSLDYAKFLNAPTGDVQFTLNEVRDWSSDLLKEVAVYTEGVIVVKDHRVLDELRKKGLTHVNPATRRWLYALAAQRKAVTLSDGDSVRGYAEAKKLPLVFTDKTAKVGEEELSVGVVVTHTPMTPARQRLVVLLGCLFRFDGSVWVPCVDANSFAKKQYEAIQKTGIEPFVAHMNIAFPPKDIPEGVRDGPALLAHLTRCIMGADPSAIHMLTSGIMKELLELPPLQRNNQGQAIFDPKSPIKYANSLDKPVISADLNPRHIGFTGGDIAKVYAACVATGAMWSRSLATHLIRGSDSIALPTENQYLTELLVSISLCYGRVAISGVGPAVYEKVLSSLERWISQRPTTPRIIVSPDRLLNSGKWKEYLTLNAPDDSYFPITVCESPFGTFEVSRGSDVRAVLAAYKNQVSEIMAARQDMIPPNGILIGRLLPEDKSIICYRTRLPSDGFGIFSRSVKDLKRVGSKDGLTLMSPEPLQSMDYPSWYNVVLKAVNTHNAQFAAPYVSKIPYYANLIRQPLVKESVTTQGEYVDLDGLIYSSMNESADVGEAAQVQQAATSIRQKKYVTVSEYVPHKNTISPVVQVSAPPIPVVSTTHRTVPGSVSTVTTSTPAPGQGGGTRNSAPPVLVAVPPDSQAQRSGGEMIDVNSLFLSDGALV